MWRGERTLGQRLASMLPALVLGLAAGVTGGAYVATSLDTTPYDQADLNTASRDAMLSGRTQGLDEGRQATLVATSKLKESNAEQVSKLETEVSRLRHTLAKRDRAMDRLTSQAEQREAQLEASLAETTAALSNATSSSGGSGHAIEGTIRTTWVVTGRPKSFPTDCSGPLGAYGVRVTAGADATVATGRVIGADLVKRTVRGNRLTLRCALTYTADLPTPLGSGYRVVTYDAKTPDAVRAVKPLADGPLSNGNGPVLAVFR